jgi:hypothetical protein
MGLADRTMLCAALAGSLCACLDRVTLVRHEGDVTTDGVATADRSDGSTIDDDGASTPDANVDGALDAIVDSATSDGPNADAATDASPEAPRLLAPMSTSFLTGARPTLRWRRRASTEQVQVQVCADRACTRVEDSRTVSADSIEWPVALAPGTHFWRAFGRNDSRNSDAPSATWQFHVPRVSRARTNAWGSFTDFNGDGLGDAAIGSPEARDRAGVVQVHHGSMDSIAAAPTVTIAGSSGRFGFAVISAGDVNGDGFADLAVGAPDDNSETGSVFVLFGSPSGIDPMAARTSISGRSPGDFFGQSIAAAGDVDGDGYGDFIVGAPNANSAQGRAWVYFGSAGGLSGSGVELVGEREPASRFGAFVTGACDLDRDGVTDLVVGAPTGRAGSGVVHLYRGGSRTISTRTAIEPVAPSDLFGFALTRAGDVDGDGFCDLLVGAPNSNALRGAVHLYSSRTNWSVAEPSASRAGPAQSEAFGYALAEARDLDGDGLDDVAIGAPGNAASSWLYVFRGSMTTTLDTAPWSSSTLIAEQYRFARAIGGRADFNGDGLFDLIVSEPEWGTFSGRVAILHGGASAMSIARRFVSTFAGYFGGGLAWRFTARRASFAL